jgi:hypothetical protein
MLAIRLEREGPAGEKAPNREIGRLGEQRRPSRRDSGMGLGGARIVAGGVAGEAEIGRVPGGMLRIEVQRPLDQVATLVGASAIGRERRPQRENVRVIGVQRQPWRCSAPRPPGPTRTGLSGAEGADRAVTATAISDGLSMSRKLQWLAELRAEATSPIPNSCPFPAAPGTTHPARCTELSRTPGARPR